jgi:hypothetical protein
MVFFPITLSIAVGLGYLTGGRLRKVLALPVPRGMLAMVWVAFVLQVLGVVIRSVSGLNAPNVVLSVLALGIIAWVLVAFSSSLLRRDALKRIYVGSVLAAAGWLLNTAVISANGGMPYSESALRRAGAATQTDLRSFEHVRGSTNSVLPFLGDVIPVPPLHVVVSAGDILFAVGVSMVVAFAMSGWSRQLDFAADPA